MGVKECKSTYDGVSYGNDNTCGDYLGQQQNTSYSYCLYNSGSGGNVCNYVRDCRGGYDGEPYGNDNTCGGYWWSSSSSVIPPPPSSAAMSSSSVNYCDINAYKQVEIGYKTWMAENYNCDVTGSRCYDGTAQCNVYGRLYNWATAMDIDKRYNKEEWDGSEERRQGICPSGWHIPSQEDWDDLLYSVDWPDGASLKATTGWSYYEYDDYYEFSAMPGGYGYLSGNSYTYEDVGYSGRWWSATQISEEYAYALLISYNNESAEWDYEYSKDYLFSVRCVKDY